VAIYAIRAKAAVEAPAVAAFVAFMTERLGAARWELG